MSKQTLETKDFIQKAIKVHGGNYNYDKSVYTGSWDKITITCVNHGNFELIANNHLNGYGCVKCNREEKIKKLSYLFKQTANKIHNNKYNYDKSNYIYSTSKVIITCPSHGDFLQTPNGHLSGKGCPKCKGDNKRSNTKDFIQKAILKHGDKFGYEKTVYEYSNKKVTITCYKHGDFQQKPNDHLNGQGCPVCRESKGEQKIFEILTKYDIPFRREFKFPCSDSRYEYDFYLPIHNVLIEFHGKQHYEPIEFFGGQQRLEYTQDCDKKKRQLAKHFKKHLLEIHYKSLKLNDKDFENMIFYNIKKLLKA